MWHLTCYLSLLRKLKIERMARVSPLSLASPRGAQRGAQSSSHKVRVLQPCEQHPWQTACRCRTRTHGVVWVLQCFSAILKGYLVSPIKLTVVCFVDKPFSHLEPQSPNEASHQWPQPKLALQQCCLQYSFEQSMISLWGKLIIMLQLELFSVWSTTLLSTQRD